MSEYVQLSSVGMKRHLLDIEQILISDAVDTFKLIKMLGPKHYTTGNYLNSVNEEDFSLLPISEEEFLLPVLPIDLPRISLQVLKEASLIDIISSNEIITTVGVNEFGKNMNVDDATLWIGISGAVESC